MGGRQGGWVGGWVCVELVVYLFAVARNTPMRHRRAPMGRRMMRWAHCSLGVRDQLLLAIWVKCFLKVHSSMNIVQYRI